jgi:hypothetical protein
MGIHHGKRSTGNSSTGYTKRATEASAGGSQLYAFTSFTFNTGGATGATGANLATFKSNYDTTTYSWLNDTSFYNVTTLGFQQWTVPSTGSYQFVVTGAGGGTGGYYSVGNNVPSGKGAKLTFTRTLTQSDVLYIAVGHKGVSGNTGATCSGGSSGGGGGTFIYDNTNSQLIAVAGGGGGGGNDSAASSNYQPDGRTASNDGGTADGSSTVPGGTNGSGGTFATSGTYGCVSGGFGGGGYSGDGGGSYGGKGYNHSSDPLKGGAYARNGGFGGGGASNTYNGGGGGGYSGGAGGGLPTCSCSNLSGGGGGGSYYIGGLGTITTAVDSSFQQDGSVVVTKV